jgi:hypothetical protein
MKVIKTTDTNLLLLNSKSSSLMTYPAVVDNEGISTYWKLTFKEKMRLLFGRGKVMILVKAKWVPPLYVKIRVKKEKRECKKLQREEKNGQTKELFN